MIPDIELKNALSRLEKASFSIAAPSFVIPGTVADNAQALAGLFPEVGIVLFESKSCLEYDENDLPAALGKLDLRWHVHLPLDLPWHAGVDEVCRIISKLVSKVDYLSPRAYVLHPPQTAELMTPLAAGFRDMGVDPSRVLLENVEESDLAVVWDEACSEGFGVCLDLGHVLAYRQDHILTLPSLWEKVGMLHVYSPGERARHESLKNLNEHGKNMLGGWLSQLRPDAVVMLEIFNETGLKESTKLLAEWLANWDFST